MKGFFWTLLALALVLSACGTNQTPAPADPLGGYVSPNLDTTYEGATSARNQLALGILMLDGTAQAVTAEQAASLIPLWQALRSTSQSGGSAEAEISALLEQIEGTLTVEQLAAIRELQITQADFQAWAKENGIVLGNGSGQPGAGAGLSPEARATRQAEEGRSPESAGQMSAAVIDAVVVYLQSQVSST